jgi:nitroimidazol reductase NimA-like FMN-containing flavoprotein (pyridoxamine 5'-phosphate oxidase superfamily)
VREVDRNGLEVLERDECLRLLGTVTIGRLGFTRGALPVILPVNFRVHDDEIFVKTGPGSKLDAALAGAIVAFEVDQSDPVTHTGWSVLVTGQGREVVDPAALTAIEHAGLARWAPRGNGKVIAISTELVDGRRITTDRRDLA